MSSTQRFHGRRDQSAVRRLLSTLTIMLVWALPSPGVAGGSGDRATATLIRADEWKRFAERFVRRDGRVVDPENGGVTHSEAQGYGMILAVYAGERSAFDRIWGFTRRELQVREGDALLAWQWDPRATPRVRDMNNATDGDVLVAYALLRAAARWSDVGYARAADRIVDAIGSDLIARVSGRIVLRPGAFGFDHIPGNRGPVVNPSYFIFAAFPLFEVVRPDYPWRQLTRDAIDLLDAARTGRRGLVPDWVALSGRSVRVAEGFAQRSSYDAVRVPLYLLHGGRDPETTAAFDAAWNLNGDGPVDYHLARIGSWRPWPIRATTQWLHWWPAHAGARRCRGGCAASGPRPTSRRACT